MSVTTLSSLFDALREDHWRESVRFSGDIQEANAVMHHPFAWSDEIAEVLRLWVLKKQPCQFGRVAARDDQVYVEVLTERDLREGDEALREKVLQAKRHWKQRAVSDRRTPPHGFMLLFVSPRVALAAPDENLYRFACGLRDLAGWATVDSGTAGNPIAGDFLYLQNPDDQVYYGFRYNIDFFASAGDGRWWHDHRVPGGIAFTANSTGHMRSFQEWYSEKGRDRGEWAITQAMKTVAHAQPTRVDAGAGTDRAAKRGDAPDPIAEGRVTWLLDLNDGKPIVDSPCPFHGPIPKELQGKDWTRYAGLLHTDHNVRAEFFEDRPNPSTAAHPYLNDLTYIYDKRLSGYLEFMKGIPVAEEDVYAQTGRPETWRLRSSGRDERPSRTPEQTVDVRAKMEACNRWPSGPDGIDPAENL
jgi:hypothetical protein